MVVYEESVTPVLPLHYIPTELSAQLARLESNQLQRVVQAITLMTAAAKLRSECSMGVNH